MLATGIAALRAAGLVAAVEDGAVEFEGVAEAEAAGAAAADTLSAEGMAGVGVGAGAATTATVAMLRRTRR